MKKKWIGIMAAVLAAAAVSGSAYADTEPVTDAPGSASVDVRAKYDGVETQTEYRVDVEWGAMEFVYTASGVSQWNTATHTYDLVSEGGWSGEGNTITVKNHSNAEVQVELSFQPAAGYQVTGSFDETLLTLATAEGTEPEEAPFGTATFMLDGELDSSIDSFQTVGQITVAVK